MSFYFRIICLDENQLIIFECAILFIEQHMGDYMKKNFFFSFGLITIMLTSGCTSFINGAVSSGSIAGDNSLISSGSSSSTQSIDSSQTISVSASEVPSSSEAPSSTETTSTSEVPSISLFK